MTVILFAEATFELAAPAAVAAPERVEPDSTLRRPVARDGWGKPWIPPTSLAGHFRAHLGPEADVMLMGDEDEDGDAPGEHRPGRASVVRFLGTEVHLPDAPQSDASRSDARLPQCARTAVDQHRAAARVTTLRTSEYLPPGTRVRCRLCVDGAQYHQDVLDALRTWRPVIGGGRSTGFGTTRPVAIRYTTLDLDTPEGRRTWLTRGGPGLFTGEHGLAPAPARAAEPAIRATWEIVDALHIATGRRHESGPRQPGQRSTEPASLARDSQNRPYIPGTTWKGVLRSRCEYILGSLGLPACISSGGTCRDCLVCAAFGWSSDGGGDAETVGQRALLRFTDSPVTGATLAVRQHVALDRFTGGARDGQLYSEEVAESGRVTLEIHADRDIPPLVTAALRLALHDLHTGRLGIGSGTTRGYGTLRRTDTNDAALQAQRSDAAAALAAALRTGQDSE